MKEKHNTRRSRDIRADGAHGIPIPLLILALLTLAFIFGNSLDNMTASASKSGTVRSVIEPFLEIFVGKGHVTDNLVRKMAHVIEFFALGVVLTAICKARNIPLIWACFIGLLAALGDETIQKYTGRGSSVIDVWLDFSAVFSAAMIGWFIGIMRRALNPGR